MSKQSRTASGVSDDRTNMGNSDPIGDLPRDIIGQILARLQPESLMSLKRLNKSWYFFIRTRDQDFIAEHQSRTVSGVSDDRTNMGNCDLVGDLPRHIIAKILVRILVRLQPKSLMSLKRLNKSWYFFIRCRTKDPDFIAKHQSHAAKAHSKMLLINMPGLLCHRRHLQKPCHVKHGLSKRVPGMEKPPLFVCSMFVTELVDNGGDEGNIRCVTENIYLSHLPRSLIRQRCRDFTMNVYHCNGVLCLTKDFKTLILYSPTTADFRSIYPRGGGYNRRFDRVVEIGFGSDPGANNFKFVRVFIGNTAQVFNPSTANVWTPIPFSIQDEVCQTLRDHLSSKGYCLWLMNSRSVLCFDVGEEAFHKVPFPYESGNNFNDPKLTAWRDCVCLFWYHPGDSIEIWAVDIRNEFGNEVFSYSWTIWLRIDWFQGFSKALAFWSRGGIFMETEDEDSRMVLFNAGTGTHRLSINDFLGNQFFYFGHYVDSLASINWMRSIP